MIDDSTRLRESLAKLRERLKDVPPVDVGEWIEENTREERERKSEYGRQWWEANPGRNREYSRRWAENNPEKVRASNRKYRYRAKYGVTLEDKAVMLEEQNSSCAICGNTIPDISKAHTDHNHNTGVVRSLLCGDCNRMIGIAHEDKTILRKAIRYLSKHDGYGYDLLETCMDG